MKPSKSVNSLTNGANGAMSSYNSQMTSSCFPHHRPQPPEPQQRPKPPASNVSQQNGASAPTSPICRCRVMYLGSSVPHITKDGLQGIQEPLRELYPDMASQNSNNAGIDSWLSVWSNGILIENVDETGREVKRFFKIEALHYCAAVKYVPLASDQQVSSDGNRSTASIDGMPKFLPLDSPHARMQQSNTNPPIFASILRRTFGVKVLECHAFICKREAAANALVRCCFHAYADTMYAKQIGADIENMSTAGHSDSQRPLGQAQTLRRISNNSSNMMNARRSRSIAALNDDVDGQQSDSSGHNANQGNPNENYYPSSIMRRKSMQEINDPNAGDSSDCSQQKSARSSTENSNNLKKQYNLSKSMHQLNQTDQQIYGALDNASQIGNHSTSIHNLASSKARWNQLFNVPQQDDGQPRFYNPYASRVPSYPPQNLIDQQVEHQKQLNNSGTLRSIKSVTANSIASTLKRNKKYAKASSNGQHLDQMNHLAPPIMGFHQAHPTASATLAPSQSFMMPPVPPMFLPRLPIINGSQTMKLPRNFQQHQIFSPHAPINFETMTPKELKKLLKKSAKYGLDASKFNVDNGHPSLIPFRPMPALGQMGSTLPPPPPPALSMHSNRSATMSNKSLNQQSNQDVTDLANSLSQSHLGESHLGMQPNGFDPMDHSYGSGLAPIKSILVKPNPEFLKSKAGKKWLKQQKEFKKLLPPHLEGLPIVFGPPPMDALEPAMSLHENDAASNGPMLPPTLTPQSVLLQPPAFLQALNSQQLSTHNHPGLPMMDSNGYYSQPPQPRYFLPSGRASTASTVLRRSPHSNQQQEYSNRLNGLDPMDSYAQHYQRIQPTPHNIYSHPQFVMPPGSQQSNLMPPIEQSFLGVENGTLMQGNVNDTRQYLLSENDPSMQHRRRGHMVEQSVISLGDENDDEDQVDNGTRGMMNGQGQDDEYDYDNDTQMNGYYNQVGETSSSSAQRLYRENGENRNYEQVMPPAPPPQKPANNSHDDQSSYSSGIYKRGHINERAFSYSIRQEHKSGTNPNSDSKNCQQIDYSQHLHNQSQLANAVYENPQHQQQMIYVKRNGGLQYSGNNNNAPVDDLSTRFEGQLNMRSYVNSSSSPQVRLHM